MRYSGNRVGTNTSMDEEFQDSFGQVFPDSGSSPNFFEVVGHGSGPEAARLQGCPYSIGPMLDVIHMWHTAEWGHLMTMGSLHLHYKICCAALPKYILKLRQCYPALHVVVQVVLLKSPNPVRFNFPSFKIEMRSFPQGSHTIHFKHGASSFAFLLMFSHCRL